jgi:hypothetical protein
VSLWHAGHFVETITTEVVAAVAVDVAEVTDTMGRSGSGSVDVVETEAALSGSLSSRHSYASHCLNTCVRIQRGTWLEHRNSRIMTHNWSQNKITMLSYRLL